MLRYSALLPEAFFLEDPRKNSFKSNLKAWVRNSVPPDGDFIFKGKIKDKTSTDWLTLELEMWKRTLEHERYSNEEFLEIEEL